MLAVVYESCGMVARKEHHMPRQYPPHFRREMVDRMLGGEAAVALVLETSVPEQTLHR